jgi:hypothetical protein
MKQTTYALASFPTPRSARLARPRAADSGRPILAGWPRNPLSPSVARRHFKERKETNE